MRRYVAVKPTNKAGVPSWRSQWSEASHPRGNRAVPHVPDSVPDFARPRDESVTAAGRLADLLTSCAAARPKGGAGCVSAHVRICPGPPGKPGGYRDVGVIPSPAITSTTLRGLNCVRIANYRAVFESEIGPFYEQCSSGDRYVLEAHLMLPRHPKRRRPHRQVFNWCATNPLDYFLDPLPRDKPPLPRKSELP